MKSNGVDAWLKHWLKLQKRNKHSLVLKRPLDRSDNACPTNEVASKGKGKRKKSQYIELNPSSNRELEDKSDDDGKGEDESATVNHPAERGGEE